MRHTADCSRIADGPSRAPMRTACVPASNGMPSTAALAFTRSQDCGAPMKVCTGAKTDSSKMLTTAFSFMTDGARAPARGKALENSLRLSIRRRTAGDEPQEVVHEAPCAADFRLPRLLLMLSPGRIGDGESQG